MDKWRAWARRIETDINWKIGSKQRYHPIQRHARGLDVPLSKLFPSSKGCFATFPQLSASYFNRNAYGGLREFCVELGAVSVYAEVHLPALIFVHQPARKPFDIGELHENVFVSLFRARLFFSVEWPTKRAIKKVHHAKNSPRKRNVGKYQNGTSYTRVSARHNWDARAPLWVNVSKGFRAKNVLSPSSLPAHCRSWEHVVFATFDRIRLPTLFLTLFTLLKFPLRNRNHRRKLYSTRNSIESCSSLLSAGVRAISKKKKNFRSGHKERTKKKKKTNTRGRVRTTDRPI